MQSCAFRCALIAALMAAIGCQKTESITTYSVPKEPAPPTAATSPPAASTAPAADRMLAAILPDGDRAWFLKVTGPLAEVDAKAREIAEFFASTRLAPGEPHPKWKVPPGWQEQGPTGMRAATLLVPAGGAKPLELSVTVLPWTGRAGELLSNVNRWRGQLQLAAIDEAGLADISRELKVGGATMTVVDLRGQMSGGMMPPFAGGGGGALASGPFAAGPSAAAPAANAGATVPTSELPPGHPPIDAGAASSTPMAGSAPFTSTTPSGWVARPASGMRKQEFRVERDGKQATLTAIDFPANAGPMMADPLANARRWRGEVGLEPLGDDELKQSLGVVTVDGGEATFVDAVPDPAVAAQSQAKSGTLAAMLKQGGTIWFFKLTGDRDLVAAERDNFQKYLESIRFGGSGGANDGKR